MDMRAANLENAHEDVSPNLLNSQIDGDKFHGL